MNMELELFEGSSIDNTSLFSNSLLLHPENLSRLIGFHNDR